MMQIRELGRIFLEKKIIKVGMSELMNSEAHHVNSKQEQSVMFHNDIYHNTVELSEEADSLVLDKLRQ